MQSVLPVPRPVEIPPELVYCEPEQPDDTGDRWDGLGRMMAEAGICRIVPADADRRVHSCGRAAELARFICAHGIPAWSDDGRLFVIDYYYTGRDEDRQGEIVELQATMHRVKAWLCY